MDADAGGDDGTGADADAAGDPDAGGPDDGSDATLADLRTVADYQFGAGAGEALFPPGETLDVSHSNAGRPRQVRADAGRVVSYGTDGRFTLGTEGGRCLRAAFDPPRCRVAVGDESVPYVREGRNAFAKFVRDVDPDVRPGDEVLVVYDPEAPAPADDGAGDGDGGGHEGGDAADAEGGDGTDGADADDPGPGPATPPDALLAVGTARLPADAMPDFASGVAVDVREGVPVPDSGPDPDADPEPGDSDE